MEQEKTESCVHCGGALNASVTIDGANVIKPRPNDFTICMYCGQPYYFDEQLEKVPLSQDQYRKLPQHDKDTIKEAWNVRMELLRMAQQQQGRYDK